MDKDTLEYILAWIQKADNDLKNAKIVLSSDEESKPFDTVCFHCQQAVEKYLKAYLIYLNKDFPRTHNLAWLIEAGMIVDNELLDLLKAETLTPYAVNTRYPDDCFAPSCEETKTAYAVACEVRAFVMKKINPIVEEMTKKN